MNSIKIVDDNALMVQLTVSQIKGIVKDVLQEVLLSQKMKRKLLPLKRYLN